MQAKLTAKHIEKLREMAVKCKAKEDATDDDINSMMALEFPNTPSGKCLHACMQETIGVVSIRICNLFENIVQILSLRSKKVKWMSIRQYLSLI